ncbi:ABC transporter permease [Phytoactinopolyspora mesophila]|uniref:ABC transporter permease subunit n=1 Tax=Phytoactinopolyspora mesophila TaxID=2650750 RepID=A0A7K3MC00_9ACTN|nr:ABC transporter permease [Phytoactinopolyspora mesophila]NDL60823.1 ABC transporter permease subunit [Phytoactinopolyspora mesophila]
MANEAATYLPAGSPEDSTGDAGPERRRSTAGFGRYVLNRASGAVVSLVAVLFTGFFIFRILPRDPVEQIMLNTPNATPELEAALRSEFGLDRPLLVQFWEYLTNTLSGDLGVSIQYQVPVTQIIADRLWPTVLLSGTALVLCVTVGFSQGAIAAWRNGSKFDKRTVNIALLLYAAPAFWVGMIAIIVFARELRLFPTGRMVSATTPNEFWPRLLDTAHHMVLPTLTMSAMLYAGYLLIMRASMLDEMGNDYITTARAKGLRDAVVRRKHAMRNALLPTTTLVFMAIGNVINGAVFTETVFTWPGLGYTFFQAISVPDLPVLQGLFIVFSASTILANLTADILYWFIDPRSRKA